MIDHSYSKYSSLYGSGGSMGGALGAWAYISLRPNLSKNLRGLDDPLSPPYLKVWIRHCMAGQFG